MTRGGVNGRSSRIWTRVFGGVTPVWPARFAASTSRELASAVVLKSSLNAPCGITGYGDGAGSVERGGPLGVAGG